MRMRRVMAGLALGLTMTAAVGAQESGPLGQQTVTVVKDPMLAVLLGIAIPGGGQFYTGQTAAGAVVLGTALFGAARSACSAPVSGILAARCLVDRQDWTTSAALGAWIAGAVWAPFNARRWNQEHGLRLSVAPVGGGASFGLSITLR